MIHVESVVRDVSNNIVFLHVLEYEEVRKTIGVFFQKRYGITAQPDQDVSESLCVPAATSTPEPVDPELDPVSPEECCIPGPNSSESKPVSSEGLVEDISEAISEQKCPTLVFHEDLTDPEGPSAEVGESGNGNDQSGTDASPETAEKDIPAGECQQSTCVATLQ